MSAEKMIRRVLNEECFVSEPPVLLDLGASTHLHPRWKMLAPYSVAVVFDPDKRETEFWQDSRSRYRKMITVPAIVHAERDGECDFYLTHSPECSSTLEPDQQALALWSFAGLFAVEKKCSLPCVTLPAVLHEYGLDRVDGYKSDTQGTDLRLWKSLPETVRNKVLWAEFEPGLMDAYIGEDKLPQLLAYMDTLPAFRLIRLTQHGSCYLEEPERRRFAGWRKRLISSVFPAAPGWAETEYLNTLRSGTFSRRDRLLAWVFSVSAGEYGQALALARAGAEEGGDPLFPQLYDAVWRMLPWGRGVWKRCREKWLGGGR